jgi:hypothetical protein
MRRVVVSVPLLVTAVGGFAAAAWALAPAASAAPAAADAAPGKAVCTITDSRLTEISGMVATGGGYVVANDGSDLESHRKIFFLDGSCKLKSTVSYPTLPRDPEDMAQAKDGTIWIADIGDNPGAGERRPNIALWRLPKGSSDPTIFRMKYPDGPHDAEALLLAGDGTPIIVTKDLGKAGVYTPTAALKKGQTVALRKVGEFTPPKSTTSNPLAAAGRLTVTGGANSPDGSRVVLRTYADAFEFDVANGDVLAAITTGKPRMTPLPDEPRGESITYSADGKSFLTVSETADETADTKPKILRYTPATDAPKVQAQGAATPGGAGSDTRSWFDNLTLTDITYLIGGVGVLGLLLVGVGVFGILRARRRPPATGPEEGAFGDGGSPSGPVPDSAQSAPVSPVPSYDASAWDRQSSTAPRRGTEYRSGGEYRGGEYQSRSAQRPSGGEYRSSGAARPDARPTEPDDAAYRPTGSAGRGGVYGSGRRSAPAGSGAPAGTSGSPGGTVYGGGGSYRSGAADQYDDAYDYADPDARY